MTPSVPSEPSDRLIESNTVDPILLHWQNEMWWNNKITYWKAMKTLDQNDFNVAMFKRGTHKRTVSEIRANNGNYIGNATDKHMWAPLHVNKEIEWELVSFKAEIKNKFLNSAMNQGYKFPRKEEEQGPTTIKQAITPQEEWKWKWHRWNQTLNQFSTKQETDISNKELSQKLALKLSNQSKSRWNGSALRTMNSS